MLRNRLLVDVDRDSVAMGDDVYGHGYRMMVRAGMRLGAILRRATPEIRSSGWSWVAVVDGVVSAVWSVDHGVRLLVPDHRVAARSSALSVHFRYFLQIDPEWLYARLMEGAPADREALRAAYAPIAAERLEIEQRRRERDIPVKLLSVAGVAAISGFGAQIDLHSDTRCRFVVGAEVWTVVKADSMTMVYRAPGAPSIASLRPQSFAEVWLATAVGSVGRTRAGRAALPGAVPNPGPPVQPMSVWPPGTERWSATGDDGFVAQLAGTDSLAWYRFAVGRSLAEVVSLLAT